MEFLEKCEQSYHAIEPNFFLAQSLQNIFPWYLEKQHWKKILSSRLALMGNFLKFPHIQKKLAKNQINSSVKIYRTFLCIQHEMLNVIRCENNQGEKILEQFEKNVFIIFIMSSLQYQTKSQIRKNFKIEQFYAKFLKLY